MSALVLKMSVSLDGYVAPADGSTGWIAGGGSDDAPVTIEPLSTTVVNGGAVAHLFAAHP
jgi:riboflavin biosynthesis pyrimidine reductase